MTSPHDVGTAESPVGGLPRAAAVRSPQSARQPERLASACEPHGPGSSDVLDAHGTLAADAGARDGLGSTAGEGPNGASNDASMDADTEAAAALEPGPPRVEPPYWAVIFVSKLRDPAPGYERTAQIMFELVSNQPGYLGVESARDERGRGITISYWRAPEDFERWRDHAQHAATRDMGRERWYEHYELRWARVERQVSWSHSPSKGA
jgi:heme-degrading monooxygenase HmoA